MRAYRITLQTLIKYLFLFFVKKIVSPERAEGLMEQAHKKTAQKVVAEILRLKGLYIKIGQTLSIMVNFLPEAFTKELEQLQDAVPPHPFSEVKMRFKDDLGKPPEELFKSFNEHPIASASLAQVHEARLDDNRKLAVKLQYPDIDDIIHLDLKTIKRIFGWLHIIFPHYGLREVYNECAAMITQEIDFETEAKNIEKIRDRFTNDSRYVFPAVYPDLSSQKILTLQFIDGIKVTNTTELTKAGVDLRELAVRLIHAYCKQIFVDGIYHADPHPGNIIIIPETKEIADASTEEQKSNPFKIAFIDYGAVAHVPAHMKEGMVLFVDGLIKKDTRLLSTAMKQMGFIAKEDKEESFDKIVDYFYGKIKGIKIDDFRKINISDFQHLNDIIEIKKMDISLRELTTTFHVPKDWILMERTLILMMGLVTHLDPHLNPADIVLPYVEEFILGKDKKITDLILQSSKELLLSYINLPSEINKTLAKLREGKIIITTKHSKGQLEGIQRSARQLVYALLLCFSAGAGYVLTKDHFFEWATWAKYSSFFWGGLLGLSLLRRR